MLNMEISNIDPFTLLTIETWWHRIRSDDDRIGTEAAFEYEMFIGYYLTNPNRNSIRFTIDPTIENIEVLASELIK